MPETKSLTIRGVDESVAREFAAGAAVRGITQAEYLRRLLQLRFFANAHTMELPHNAPLEDLGASAKHLQQWILDLDMDDKSA